MVNEANDSLAKQGWNPTEHYKDEGVATRYDDERFRSASGVVFNYLDKRLIRKVFSGLPIGSCILDAPCGTGRLSEVLLEMGMTVVGVDISAAMLEVAAKRLKRFGSRFVGKVCDVRELEGLNLSVDAVNCARVLMHFPLAQQIDFLRHVAGATQGPVVFTQGLNSPYYRLRRRLKRLLGNKAPAEYPLTREQLATLTEGAGLSEVRIRFLLPWLSESVVVMAQRRIAR